MPIVGVANTSVAVVVLHQSVSGEKDMVGVPLQLLRVFAGTSACAINLIYIRRVRGWGQQATYTPD